MAKPFLCVVKDGKNNHTLALVREVSTGTSGSPFGTPDDTAKVVVCNSVTGEKIEQANLNLGDLSAVSSIKLDGRVVKLTPTIRTGITYSSTQLSSLGDFEIVDVDVKENLVLLDDPTYKEFRQRSLDAFGLTTTDSSDLYGSLKNI